MAGPTTHTDGLREAYDRLLDDPRLRRRYLDVDGQETHLIEIGEGQPLILLHGTGSPAPFFLPLLRQLSEVRVIAPERPGQGLSDPIDPYSGDLRALAVTWLDRLLDALELESAPIVGHSMGGLWGLWYAHARPERISELVVLGGAPALLGERVPLPYRVMATPGLGWLVQRFAPQTERSVVQFARFMGEDTTIVEHPELIGLLVAAGDDPLTSAAARAEARMIIAAHALLSPSSFRHSARLTPDELRQITTPTLVIWGKREPLAGVDVARDIVGLLPDGRLEVLDAGHGPWLGHAAAIAELVREFVQRGSPREGQRHA